MKKCVGAILCAILLIGMLTVTAFAQAGISDSMKVNDDGTVTVTVYVEDGLGLTDGDIRLAFDPSAYEFVSFDDTIAPDGMVAAAGLSPDEPGLCTCSFMMMHAVEADMLDEKGGFTLVSYTFKVLGDKKANIDDFLLFADSLSAEEVTLKPDPVGDVSLFEEHVTGGVTGAAGGVTPKSAENASGQSSEKAEKSKTMPIVLGALAVVVAAAAAGGVVLSRKKASVIASGEGDEPDVSAEKKKDESLESED